MKGHSDYTGQVLDGRYRVERLLGAGGMGAVYEGSHVLVGRKVAIKFLHAELTGQEEIVKRFYREAQAAAAIRHKNIIDVLDVGLSSLGEPYMVMEYLEGESLAAMLHRVERLDLPAAAGVLEPVLLALKAAHEKGIVHRDLKPDNIFLAHNPDEPPTVKLIDFGISKFSGGTGGSQLTQTGSTMGTPAYMSPEQVRGERTVDARSDLYSMGVVLYEMLTGALPFRGEHYNALLINVLTAAPTPPREAFAGFPAEAERLVERALSKSPAERPQSAAEFLAELRSTSAFASRQEHLTRFASSVSHRSFAAGDLGDDITQSDADAASDVYARMQRVATPGTWAATRVGTSGGRSRVAILAGSIAAVAAALAFFFALHGGAPTEQPPAVQAGAPRQVAAQERSAAQDAVVFITVFGAPPGAKIGFDGAPVQENPFKVLQRDASFVLSVEAEGYEPFKVLVSTKKDKIVDVALKALAPACGEAADGHGTKPRPKKEEAPSAAAPAAKIESGKHGMKFGKDFE